MRDTTATGPGTRARRRPRSPGTSFRIIRVWHVAARQIVLPVLTTMSFVPQFHVMLEHAIAKTHLEHQPFSFDAKRKRKRKEKKRKKTQEDWGKGWRGSSIARVANNTWELIWRRLRVKWPFIHLWPVRGESRVATRAWLTSVRGAT